MAAEIGIYNGAQVQFNFAGLDCNVNMGDSFILIEPDGPSYATGKGHDGSILRADTNEQLYHITVRCKRASSVNALLTAVWQTDRAAGGGAGIAPIFVKDPNGSSFFLTDKAWIAQPASIEFTKAQDGDAEWKLDAQAVPGQYFCGGNSLP